MDFSYVAGFFDGEGCVRIQRESYSLQITMVQSTKQDAVLFRIKEFLEEQGITVGTYTGLPGKKFPNAHPLRTIFICNSSDLVKFLEGVMPFLIVKRVKAAEALTLAKTKQARKDATADRLALCERMYLAGASTSVLRKKCGVNHDQVRAHFNKVGIIMRTHKEASQLRWAKQRQARTS